MLFGESFKRLVNSNIRLQKKMSQFLTTVWSNSCNLIAITFWFKCFLFITLNGILWLHLFSQYTLLVGNIQKLILCKPTQRSRKIKWLISMAFKPFFPALFITSRISTLQAATISESYVHALSLKCRMLYM